MCWTGKRLPDEAKKGGISVCAELRIPLLEEQAEILCLVSKSSGFAIEDEFHLQTLASPPLIFFIVRCKDFSSFTSQLISQSDINALT